MQSLCTVVQSCQRFSARPWMESQVMETAVIVALLAIALLLLRIGSAIERLRVEISSARWEVGRMARLKEIEGGGEVPKSLDR